MEQRARDIIAGIVLQTRGLSQCRNPKAVAIIRGERLVALYWSKSITGLPDINTSPVVEAIKYDFKVGDKDDAILICSELPTVDDLKALYLTDIREIHFVGELDKPDSVEFLNKLSKTSPENGFKIVQLFQEK